MSNKDTIIDVINSLPGLKKLKPATDKQISDAEKQLGVTFADEYKEYLSTFGVITADGIELTGISNSEYRDVVRVTKKNKELNPKVPNSYYVVEDTGMDGIVIWQDSKGNIYQSNPGKKPVRVSYTLKDYIKRHAR